MLKFFGRGSAFSDAHNSAFFIDGNDLILIDCPATTFQKIKNFDFHQFENIYVLVTHTHGDHTGGIGTFLQYLFFIWGIKLTVVAPSMDVCYDLTLLLKRIEGCEEHWFHLVTAEHLKKRWLIQEIPTVHAPTLANKCFGYLLNVDHQTTIFTGDTHTLEPFLPFIQRDTVLYTEIAYYKSDVHLFYADVLPILEKMTQNEIEVFLMHLDNEPEISKMIQNTKIHLAPLYEA